MTIVKQVSRYHFRSDDGKVEIYIRMTGRKVVEGKWNGAWKYSPGHADMMPHQDTYTIYLNEEPVARDILDDDIKQEFRRLKIEVARF